MKIIYEQLRAAGNKPRFHGAGFIQLYIGDARRLHIWHPDFPAIIKDGVIHDHNFDMHSKVIFGKLNHVAYEFEKCEGGPRSMWNVAAKADASQSGEGEAGLLKLVGSYEMVAGSEYHFRAKEFHEIIAGGLTVTLMRKKVVHKDHWPRAIAFGDGPPGNAFPLAPPHTEEALWQGIKEGIECIKA